MLGVYVYGPVTPPLRRVANWSCKIQADSGPRPNKHGGVIGQKGGFVRRDCDVTSSNENSLKKLTCITEIGMASPWAPGG